MGVVKEEIRICDDPRCGDLVDVAGAIIVVAREEGEIYEPWRIVSFHLMVRDRMTPRELRELGAWMMREGRRIGREYTASGAPRKR